MTKIFADKNKLHKLIFWTIFVIGALFRLLLLGKIPAGVHPDEAFAGYEAYSMLHYGVDSWGYHLPVYFVSWGSGMNVLESYLMMPFVALLGLNEVAIRLPQVLLAILAMPAMYGLLKEAADEKLGLIGMGVLAASPWQFMYSRWGCESNLCPSMLLIASYFLFVAMKRTINNKAGARKCFVLAAIFFGLDLYCYAATWILVAAVILAWAVYFFIFFKKEGRSFDKKLMLSLLIFGLILMAFALPLILFILVNLDIIPQLTGLVSIPRLVVFRGDELMDTSVLLGRIHYFAHILVAQEDGRPWNAIAPYGLFYSKLSIIVILLGIVYAIRALVRDIKERKFSAALLLVIYASLASILVIIQRVDIISSNYLQIAIVIFWAVGIYAVFGLNKKWLSAIIGIFYAFMIVVFLNIYFRYYPAMINESLPSEARQVIDDARSLYDEGSVDGIVVTDKLSHAQVLFYTKYPVYDYMGSASWQEYPSRYLAAKSFGPFSFIGQDEESYDTSKAYIVGEEEALKLGAMGFSLVQYDNLYLAIY